MKIKNKIYTEEIAEEISELLELLSYKINYSSVDDINEVINLIKLRIAGFIKN